MATPFHVELVTPERVLFSGDADEVSTRTEAGEITFLAHHEEFIGALDIAVVRINVVSAPGPGENEHAGEELRAAAHGGFVYVDDEGVTILAGVAELAAEIDVERARRALAAAGERAAAEPSGAEQAAAEPESHGGAQPSGALLAVLAPDAAEVAERRARVRLEAAGAETE